MSNRLVVLTNDVGTFFPSFAPVPVTESKDQAVNV